MPTEKIKLKINIYILRIMLGIAFFFGALYELNNAVHNEFALCAMVACIWLGTIVLAYATYILTSIKIIEKLFDAATGIIIIFAPLWFYFEIKDFTGIDDNVLKVMQYSLLPSVIMGICVLFSALTYKE